MTVAKLIKKLDGIFSEYIRRRDSNKHTGMGRCCTCITYAHWKDMQCGHCVRRGNHSVRWDVRNANMQCPVCNTNGGKTKEHKDRIAWQYGWDTVDELEQLGRTIKRYRQTELLELIEIYKAKLTKLGVT